MMREYYMIAFFIIIMAIVWFMWRFEKRKPKEREVVMLAVMTSMAIVGRVIFFMTPQFKPSVAIIIITGIMLGKQAGFLSGVLTAFISNFFFGQGPWTPWQMIALGLIGLLSAMIFSGKREKLAYHKIFICVYGFIVTLSYGIIMDTATMLIAVDKPSISALIVTISSGIIFNLIHGISTVIFLWILSGAMFAKIKRLKVKYEMYCE